MTMIVANIYEVKAKLSEYLEAVGRGERVLICKRNQPVAELRAVAAVRTEPRPIAARYQFEVPASFFESLPDEIVGAFYGEVPLRQGHGKVAGERPEHAAAARRRSKRARR